MTIFAKYNSHPVKEAVGIIMLLMMLILVPSSPAAAQANKASCSPCRSIQHAANLAAIEKRLLQVTDSSIESLDDNARDWYAKFQKGGLFFDGWQEISADVVEKVPEENKIKTKVTMLALGIKIGCEWSKENDVRKITTAMLQEWGRKLRETVSESPEQLVVVISSIESEVDELLF